MSRKSKSLEKLGQISFLTDDGDIIDKNIHGSKISTPSFESELPKSECDSIKNHIQFVQNEIMETPAITPEKAHSHIVTQNTTKTVDNMMPNSVPKEMRIGEKLFQYRIQGEKGATVFELKIREKGKTKYETFQITFSPYKVIHTKNLQDDSSYLVLDKRLNCEKIIKTGGTKRSVYGGKVQGDEYTPIRNMNYFRFIFKLSDKEAFHDIVIKEIREHILKQHYNLLSDEL